MNSVSIAMNSDSSIESRISLRFSSRLKLKISILWKIAQSAGLPGMKVAESGDVWVSFRLDGLGRGDWVVGMLRGEF